MRRVVITLSFALIIFSSASVSAHAANLPLLDPNFHIVPDAHQINPACPVGAPLSYGAMLQLLQNLMNTAISLGVVAFILVAAYAGASFMLNPTNPEARSKARGMLINVVVGMIIVLTAWLIVDFVMKTLYNPAAVLSGDIPLGAWNEILSPNSGDQGCILEHSPTALQGVLGHGVTAEFGGGKNQVLASGGTGACNASKVQSAAVSGGYNITAYQANVLACLAQPESSCGANTSGARTRGGQTTSASGPWQILLGAPDKCHSLTIPACGNLQCSNAYSGGHVKSDSASQALAARCQAAANNLNCSAAAAACIVQQSGGSFSAWTGTGDGYSHSAQQACAGG